MPRRLTRGMAKERAVAKKVLVIGELNVDLIVSGLPSLPRLGQELPCTGFARVLGSSSAIFARALAGLGAGVDFMGKVGDDDNGHFMVGQLQEIGIGTQGVVVDPAVQTGVTISLTYPHEKAQITYPGSMAEFRLAEINLDVFREYTHLHTATMYLQTGLKPDFPRLLAHARAMGLTTSLDPGWDSSGQWEPLLAEALAYTDILFINEHEAKAMARTESLAEAVEAMGRRAPLVVVKLGPDGAVLLDRAGRLPSPPFPMEVVDTTGAGDSFDAGFIYRSVLQGASRVEALRFANACGAIAVTRTGGASSVPAAAEVENFLRDKS